MTEPNEMTWREFDELVPFHINHTLSDSDQKRFDDFMARHPEAASSVTFTRSITQAARSVLTDRPPMQGYEAMKTRLDLELADTPPPPRRSRTQARGIWQRIGTLLTDWGMSPAIAAVLLVLATQLTLTVSQMQETENAGIYRGIQAGVQNAELKIVISPKATFEDIMALLARSQCKIVWGPSSIGEIWLKLDDPSGVKLARERLSRSPLIENVALLPNKGP